jgi:flavin-binding protein dodecin
MRWPDGSAVRPFACADRFDAFPRGTCIVLPLTFYVRLEAAGVTYLLLRQTEWEDVMSDSVYKVIELVGTSKESWEKAATVAVERAAKTLRDLRVAEVVKLDMQLDAKGKVEAYRAKLNVSFKFEGT